jgi:hypothetical protein
MAVTVERVYKLADQIKEKVPSTEIKFKDESWFMKLLGYLAFFNPKFMTSFTTVVGSKIYFTTRSDISNNAAGAFTILAHEYRHMYDSMGFFKSLLYRFLYFCPQILAPLMFLFLLLPISYIISIPLSIVLFLAFLSPIPSPGRMYYELKGYTTSLFVKNELYKEKNWDLDQRRFLFEASDTVNFMNDQFVKSYYYYMWPFGVKDKIKNALEKILSEEIVAEDSFYADLKQMIANTR